MAAYIIVILRLIIPLSIIKRPFLGAVLSMAIDIADFSILQKYGFGFMSGGEVYQPLDKLLDIYYLSLELRMTYYWKELFLKRMALGFFLFRLAGFFLFEFTGLRYILVLAPNLFESFYLVVAFRNRVMPSFRFTVKKMAIIILILLLQKMPLEYSLHVKPLEITDKTLEFLRSSPKTELLKPLFSYGG